MKDEARRQILEMVENYCNEYHKQDTGKKIPYARRVYDKDDMCMLVDSALDFWLTSGRFTDEFEDGLKNFLSVKFCSLVNSGSSANLLAFMSLTSPLLGQRRIFPGDEVITVAAGFPTTIAPIIQYGAVPVFVDVDIPSYNVDIEMLNSALSEKTKAVILAHTLGNPFNIDAILDFCKAHNLWLIEDNCDALGSEYFSEKNSGKTGSFGHIGTSSFYPPHHMTMGEGGAVYTNDPLLHKIIRSMRDWGRDCSCPSGVDNFCGHRFDGQYGKLPLGYDHKYVYSHFGYNLKATDMQAAIGVSQLKKLPAFIEARRSNFSRLLEGLRVLEDKLILPEPEKNSNPSWFGFLMTCRNGIKRGEIVKHIESSGIQTRMLFAGNIINHPCFDEMRANNIGYRVVDSLCNTDRIMNDSFWIGVYPGLSEEQLDYMIDVVKEAATMQQHCQ